MILPILSLNFRFVFIKIDVFLAYLVTIHRVATLTNISTIVIDHMLIVTT